MLISFPFSAMLEEYKAAPEIMRTRLLIDTLEDVLSAGKLYIVDGSTTRLLTLNGANAEEAAAVSGGDK